VHLICRFGRFGRFGRFRRCGGCPRLSGGPLIIFPLSSGLSSNPSGRGRSQWRVPRTDTFGCDKAGSYSINIVLDAKFTDAAMISVK
jgi:hypothetical protein